MTKTMTEPARNSQPHRRSVLRGASGAVTASLVILLLVVIASQIFFQLQGSPGLGWPTAGGHAVAAVLAVLLQRAADRRAGVVSALACLAVLADAALTLWLYWWS